jgi:N utilization substance protein B
MQALYSWHHAQNKSASDAVDEMVRGIERTYDLYLTQLRLFPELAHQEEKHIADAPERHITKAAPVRHPLSENFIIKQILANDLLSRLSIERGISWQNDTDVLQKIFFSIRKSEPYLTYNNKEYTDDAADTDLILELYKNIILRSDVYLNALEEKNIWWADALEFINSMVMKTLKQAHPDRNGSLNIMPQLRELDEDKEFIRNLFNLTIDNDLDYSAMIGERTKNWDVDRIAQLDIILLKMALCEILNFENVPVKVSINEYLDLSKEFSTPKSKVFINGVLDSIVQDLKKSGSIQKTGRGLLE